MREKGREGRGGEREGKRRKRRKSPLPEHEHNLKDIFIKWDKQGVRKCASASVCLHNTGKRPLLIGIIVMR